VAAAGFTLFALVRYGSFMVSFLPAIVVLGLGMAITVAPLTTTVMSAVSADHSGVASGVNNAVSRVAGLVAIAVFGIVVVHTFNSRLTVELERLSLPADTRAAIDHERPKMAGVDVRTIPSLQPNQREEVRDALDTSFGEAFCVAMLGAAGLAVLAAAVGAAIPSRRF
jgi:hypothetical protein